jgi:hypothetical protein
MCATCWGAFSSIEKFSQPILAGKAKTAQGLVFTHSFPNAFGSVLAIEFGLRGHSSVATGSPFSGVWALDNAVAAINDGVADAILVGASEAICPTVFANYETAGAVSQEKPLGEGAAFLVLENIDSAKNRGVNVKASLGCEVSGNPVLKESEIPACLLTNMFANDSDPNKPENLSSLYGETLSVNPLMAAIYAVGCGAKDINVSFNDSGIAVKAE